MIPPQTPHRVGFSDEFGKPLDNRVDRWFEHGVKTTDEQVKKGFCTTKQTLYAILFIVTFVLIALAILIPVIIGNVKKS